MPLSSGGASPSSTSSHGPSGGCSCSLFSPMLLVTPLPATDTVTTTSSGRLWASSTQSEASYASLFQPSSTSSQRSSLQRLLKLSLSKRRRAEERAPHPTRLPPKSPKRRKKNPQRRNLLPSPQKMKLTKLQLKVCPHNESQKTLQIAQKCTR